MSSQTTLSIAPLDPSLVRFVAVSGPGSPDFNAARAALPEAVKAGVAPILPYSILVKNIAAQDLVGISILFEVTENDGKILKYSFNYHDLTPPFRKRFIAGQSRIVSASQLANAAISESRSEVLHQGGVTLEQIAGSLHAKKVVASIDAAITLEGRYIGPDKVGAFKRIVQESKADADLVSKLSMSPSTTAMLEELNKFAELKVSPRQDPFNADFYTLRLVNESRRLRDYTQRGDSRAITTFIEHAKNRMVVTRQ